MGEDSDCLSCRLISGFGFIGIGTYIIFQGNKSKGLNKPVLKLVGSCFAFIGLARLLNVGPFTSKSNLQEPESTHESL